MAGEFRSQPRLADAGLAGYHYQLAPSRRGPCPCLLQPVQLGAPADQRRPRRGGEDWRQARRVLARAGRGGGQVEGGVLAQDLLLKAAQSRSRVDAELRGEIVADPPVSAQSVRLTAGAVQGQHQMTPELLPEWLPAYQVLKVADELGVGAERQLGLRSPFQRRQPEFFEPGRFGTGERRRGQLAIGRPAP